MALFQKRPQVESSVPLYTFGTEKTIVIFGLGNPGQKYEKTRHNLGFMCLDVFAKEHDFPAFSEKKNWQGSVTTHHLGDCRVILCKPSTYMNKSGEAVKAITQYYKLTPDDVIVIHDDLAIDFGSIRTRIGGSDGGHNGIKSIIAHIGESFSRIRAGVGPKNPAAIDSSDFVLARFTKSEEKHLPIITKECNALLTETIYGSGKLPTETRNTLI